jgi:hypothetical protein
MIKLPEKRLTELDLHPIKLPHSCWIEAEGDPYRVSFRTLDAYQRGRGDRSEKVQQLVKWSKSLANIGTEVWVCMDISNGHPDMHYGRIYLWVFTTPKKATEKYLKHKKNKKITTLLAPVRCLIVDEVKLIGEPVDEVIFD